MCEGDDEDAVGVSVVDELVRKTPENHPSFTADEFVSNLRMFADPLQRPFYRPCEPILQIA